ncbi:DegV family protein [Streptococcus sp. 20-1249]|uniref:DegV family protein n=1 Tax=Streptococcus hepaticus TaxID=3349163 RepID=UPI003747EA7D
MKKWKIVADSGCDIVSLENVAADTDFVRVPLTIQVENEIFVDNDTLDIDQMMETMYASHTAAKSACPSPQAFQESFEGAENVFVITITGGLSGSNNSARLGKEMLQEEHPEVNVHVIDSLSAGGEMDLIVAELNRLIASGLEFDQVVEAITTYQKRTKLLFVLAKVDNLVKNGRLSKLLGKVVGLLNIRMVGEASETGTLELLQKARGYKKSLKAAFEEMKKAGYRGGRITIAHRRNEKFCQEFAELVRSHFPQAQIEAFATSGLCSFYAEDEGILMGYEVG